jgi:hypothetical protein
MNPGPGVSTKSTGGSAASYFLIKLNQCIVSAIDSVSACTKYTWPLNNVTYYSNTSSPIAYTTSPTGCDSIVTLHLTIETVSDTSTTQTNGSFSANNLNATYQWLDCSNNFSIIAGATSKTFTPNTNGSYAVQLTENGCIDTSGCRSINNIGNIEENAPRGFTVYPNPTKGPFKINIGSISENGSLRIYNLLGQCCYSVEIPSVETLPMDLSLPKGAYTVVLMNHKGFWSEKLLVE